MREFAHKAMATSTYMLMLILFPILDIIMFVLVCLLLVRTNQLKEKLSEIALQDTLRNEVSSVSNRARPADYQQPTNQA